MTFKEAKEQAIAEAMELNRNVGFHKWKTVSMNNQGDWFADTTTSDDMTKNFALGFFEASKGVDTVLDVKFMDTPICDWPNSLASVPN